MSAQHSLIMKINSVKRRRPQYLYNFRKDVGFEIITAVVIRSSVFWDIMPCSPLRVN
jgi:hypothetical protein